VRRVQIPPQHKDSESKVQGPRCAVEYTPYRDIYLEGRELRGLERATARDERFGDRGRSQEKCLISIMLAIDTETMRGSKADSAVLQC
jgi:hypothetical protein